MDIKTQWVKASMKTSKTPRRCNVAFKTRKTLMQYHNISKIQNSI